jgi:hypothetical protein
MEQVIDSSVITQEAAREIHAINSAWLIAIKEILRVIDCKV